MNKTTSKTMKAVLFASLTVVTILSFSAMDLAYAELPEEIRQTALQGKQIWERMDELQNKANPTEAERREATELQTDFDAVVAELNPYGIATQEQWEANPDYWITANIPAIPSEYGQTGGATAATNSCGCSQTLWFIAGYNYWLWGFWPTSVFGDWESLRNESDQRTSTAVVHTDLDRIQPFTTFTLSRPGVAEATLDMYGETEGGDIFWDPVEKNVRITSVNPSYATVKEPIVRYVAEDSEIIADVTLSSIQ
ncbi:MAG: hypothetical protein OXP12_00845 [Thaumarchaeota archaeon]|nr:hypothetical protein [Nitrososphaerota archaeon]